MTFTIAPVAPPHRMEWERLFLDYFAFYKATQPHSQVDLTWQRIVAGENPHGLVAVDESGAVIGIAHYLFHPSTWTPGPYCYLQDLYVDEVRRGSGVGRALIEAVYRAADENGSSYVYWLTQDFNAEARRLYDRIGQVTPFIKYRR